MPHAHELGQDCFIFPLGIAWTNGIVVKRLDWFYIQSYQQVFAVSAYVSSDVCLQFERMIYRYVSRAMV